MTRIRLDRGHVRCSIDPTDGGRIASLRVGTRDILVPRTDGQGVMEGGCFPMTPWAGRVRNGVFDLAGRTVELPLDLPPHAIHGTTYQRPWSVVTTTPHVVEMTIALGPHWPFGGEAIQRIELHEHHVLAEMAVTAGEVAMPAQVGWHPWFWKPGRADLRFGAMYHRDGTGIPTGELVAPAAGPVDDCFVDPLGPLQLHHAELTVTIDSDCDHWVVYSLQRRELCVEPQSGPPDAFNRTPFVLAPGETLRRWMTIAWSPAP